MAIEQIRAETSSERATTVVTGPETNRFLIEKRGRTYKHQYAGIYFVRLQLMRDSLVEKATAKWKNLDSKPSFVKRVLEIRKGNICFVCGTVYMHMPLKPNVIEDMTEGNVVPNTGNQRMHSHDDKIMLEDESGRLRLVGEYLKRVKLVSGVIISALGSETPEGTFEVIDICTAGMHSQDYLQDQIPPPKDDMAVDDNPSQDEWIAAVSGFQIGTKNNSDAPLQMLIEYLSGEAGSTADKLSSSQISRLIILGDSITPVIETIKAEGFLNGVNGLDKKVRYGQDNTVYSQEPLRRVGEHLQDINQAMPIHILPGGGDPANSMMPQQAFLPAMFGKVGKSPSFICETNPTYLTLETTDESTNRPSVSRNILLNSGQPLNDMVKYFPPTDPSRLTLLELTLRWGHIAPTTPDTLWVHPYFIDDPFIMYDTPDLYIVGCQPRFGSRMVVEKDKNGEEIARCRIVMVPTFTETKTLVLVNVRTLEVKKIVFDTENMTGGVEDKEFENPKELPIPLPTQEDIDAEEALMDTLAEGEEDVLQEGVVKEEKGDAEDAKERMQTEESSNSV